MHGPILNRPASWMLVAFAPVLGVDSKWPKEGGNSKSIRATELMMEVNDCLFEGWNEYTKGTHCEEWPDGSSAETHIVRAGSIQDKPEGDKALGSPGGCHHCYCPATKYLHPEVLFLPKLGSDVFSKMLKVATSPLNIKFIARDAEGKRTWTGTLKNYAECRAAAGGVHLLYNPLSEIINSDSHQQMLFDFLHGVDKGMIPFTMRAAMTMCIAFELEIRKPGVTLARIQRRLSNIMAVHEGIVPGQIMNGKHSCMFSMNGHVCKTFAHIHKHKGETHCTVRGCDMQLLLLVMPFVLDNLFQNEVAEWNARHPAAEHVEDPTHRINLVVVQLLDWYALARLDCKDAVEVCMMDMMARTFLIDSRNTFQDFKVGKPGTASEKHICSSEKMHRCLHAGTKITEYGNISNIGPFAEINHRKFVRSPQSLVSRSDVGGPGLLKVAERKEAARLLLEAHSGKVST